MQLNTCPSSWWALLPLTITSDKTRDTGTAGRPDPACSPLRTTLIQYGPALWVPLHSYTRAFTQSHLHYIRPQSQALALCHVYWFHSNCNVHGSLSIVLRKPISLWRAEGWLLRTKVHHSVLNGIQCSFKRPCGHYQGTARQLLGIINADVPLGLDATRTTKCHQVMKFAVLNFLLSVTILCQDYSQESEYHRQWPPVFLCRDRVLGKLTGVFLMSADTLHKSVT